MKKKSKNPTNSKLELQLLRQDYQRVIGIDEVGRGCWAGPVYVGAFVYTLKYKPVKAVTDSKLLTAEKRNQLYPKLIKQEHKVVVGEVAQINKYGIGRTVEDLIAQVFEAFDDEATFFIIDGHFARRFGKNTQQIIKGDLLHHAIAAASVIAKVERDRFMVELGKSYPEYNLAVNKGYATKAHRNAIQKYGVRAIHRTSFTPIKLLLEQYQLHIP